MTRWLWQLPLVLVVGLGTWTGSAARAQAPVIPGAGVNPPATADHGAGQVIDGAGPKDGPAPTQERRGWFHRWDPPHPLRTALHSCLNNHGVGCYATHDSIGCTSLHAELTFIFGSCRQFFGEPCFQGPPPPYPGAAPGPGGCPNGCP